MSSINPDSSRPRPPRPRRADETAEGLGGALEGRPNRPAERGPDGPTGPELPRDEFRRSHHHHRPHGHREGGMERPTPPDPAAMVERLLKADANGDGLLSRDELTAYFQQRQAERAAPTGEPPSAQPTATLTATEPTADPTADATTPSPSDILATGLTDEELASLTADEAPAPDPTSTDAVDPALTTAPTAADPASLQQQVLAWLASIQQDPQFASLGSEQQQQLQDATQAVTALDPADPAFSDSLQTLLQSYGLAE